MKNLTTKQFLTQGESHGRFNPISEEKVCVGDLTISYELIEMSEGEGVTYVIAVDTGKDRESVRISDIDAAGHFFGLITKYAVTPCTLCDVFEDMFCN